MLAADGQVGVVFGLREQHRHRTAFKAVAGDVDSLLPGLRSGALSSVAARRGAPSSWDLSVLVLPGSAAGAAGGSALTSPGRRSALASDRAPAGREQTWTA
ncbi:hypothetical protein, partial [Actinomycetospora cinnamomea]